MKVRAYVEGVRKANAETVRPIWAQEEGGNWRTESVA
jgi:hypothetical protein